MDREVADAMARSFLGKLPPEVIHQLSAEGERVDYPPGATFYREGSAPRAMLVVTGLIRVYMASRGRQVTVRYARNSDILGIALIVGGPLNVSAQTLAPSSLFNINSRALLEAAREDARVAFALSEELNRRLDDTLQQTAINAFGSVKQRVASHLLDLASAQQRPEARLVANVSQQELADAVGSVREVVARALRDLRVAGIVATSADSVLIIDAARLFDESWGSTAP
jgi:CRP/FNR family transcriptional regulator, cyclic AMP receptor protein